jgi:hypothetical protein
MSYLFEYPNVNIQVFINPKGVSCYEVSKISSTPKIFSYSDFTVDLSCNMENTKQSQQDEDYIVSCRYRPVVNRRNVIEFQAALGKIGIIGSDDNIESNTIRKSNVAEFLSDYSQAAQNVSTGLANIQPLSEITPIPRTVRSIPPPSPPPKREGISVSLSKQMDSNSAVEYSPEISSVSSIYEEKIMLQENEIEELKRQVLQLQQMLITTKGSVMEISAPASKKPKESKKRLKKGESYLDDNFMQKETNQSIEIRSLKSKIQSHDISKLHSAELIGQSDEVSGILSSASNTLSDELKMQNNERNDTSTFRSTELKVQSHDKSGVRLMEPPSMPNFDFIKDFSSLRRKGIFHNYYIYFLTLCCI